MRLDCNYAPACGPRQHLSGTRVLSRFPAAAGLEVSSALCHYAGLFRGFDMNHIPETACDNSG